jgi:hypothetical protein
MLLADKLVESARAHPVSQRGVLRHLLLALVFE